MTEADWLASDDGDQLLYSIAEKASLRKLRLVRVAFCRRVIHHLNDGRSRFALEVSEAHADGSASDEALTEARAEARAVVSALQFDHSGGWSPIISAAYGVVEAADIELRLRMKIDMIDVVLSAPKPPPKSIPPELRATQLAEADLVRDVFGNPFHPVAFDPAWRSEHTIGLAAKMYDERDFRAIPILADALEETGCDNADILTHCREPGPHARGCWVVDGVLGKR